MRRSTAGPLQLLGDLELAPGQLGLLWLGQSGFAVRIGGVTALLDPFLSDHPDRRFPPPFGPGEAAGVDLIACTHEHWDHLDAESLPALCAASPDARVGVPQALVELVIGLRIPAQRVIGMQPGRPLERIGLTIHAIPARHGRNPADAYGFGCEESSGLYRYLGYVIQGGGVRLYHAGDTIGYEGLSGRLRELGVDVALLPINGRDRAREALGIVGNLDAEEAAALAVEAGADVVVPMHHDMFAANPGHPDRLVAAVERMNAALGVVVPARNLPFVYTKPPGRP